MNNIYDYLSASFITKYKRSTKGIIRLSSPKRKLILIPEDTKNILVGLLLGDAHIVKRSLTGNSRLVYAHTAFKHKASFDYVHSFFTQFCVKDYTPQSRIIKDKTSKKIYNAISFTTMQLPCFNEFIKLFYLSSVKIVPDNLYDLSTPKGLAF